ncbi:MAG: hypothetical protein FD177_245 [Desulfovibrionaceae bacterium]|nr:MAG: hypothetical protein FD177_245 [Desulfovibrionaceae bacterium]
MTTWNHLEKGMPWPDFLDLWTQVVARVRSLKDTHGMTYEKIGELLDVNKSTVKRWLDGDRGGENTPAPALFRYMSVLGIQPQDVCREPLPDSGEYAFIRKALARPTAGGGSLETSGETEGGLVFQLAWLKQRTTSSPDRLRVMHVQGDSMSPTIEDGDVVLVDEGKAELVPDRVYVVRKGEEIYVKRFRKTPDVLLFMGDNRARDFEDVKVFPGDVNGFAVIGRVLWAGKEL